jgi:hypothetical protein
MDMTAPLVIFLQWGGTALVLWALYLYCKFYLFAPKTKEDLERSKAQSSLDSEFASISRQLKRM